ncbi:MAG TPA: hypothetical protein VFI49_08140 [Rudaea sp.]|nr:hypothetical protein [Rudaea sp.]
MRIENLEALTRGIRSLNSLRDGGEKIIGRAISTLKRRLPAQAKRDIAKQYALASREIGSRLLCKGDRRSVTLTGLGRAQTLIKFKARQTRSGVTVQIQKGSPVSIPHAFIHVPARAPGAGPQVMIRADAFRTVPGSVRDIATVGRNRHGYPIVLLGGPTVADMLRDPGREDRLSELARATFSKEVDRLQEVARNGR